MKVVIKEPGVASYGADIPNTLEDLQKVVGGYIEVLGVMDGLVIICNEEGRLQDLKYNCEFAGIDFVGTIIFAGTDGEGDFTDIPDDLARLVMRELWGR